MLFIIPPYGPIESYVPKGPGQKKYLLTPPYGILSMIAYINVNKEYDIEIIDCNKIILENIHNPSVEFFVEDAIKEMILFMRPRYIGISALFNTSFPHIEIIRNIKKYYTDAYFIIGGGLATNLYEDLFKQFPEIDAACYGEGEIPLKKLLESTNVKDASLISPAWITKESLLRKQLPEYEFVANLDDIPLIDFNYIELNKYNGRSYIDKSNSDSKIEVSIHTSRGCPFKCVFCANSKLHGKKVRAMSLKRVIETIQHYKTNYNMTVLLVEDDHFLHDKERALNILHFIRDNNINVEFPNGVTVYKIDDDIAKALSDAKIKLITLAIESASQYVLQKVINKPLSVRGIIKAINFLKKYGIRIHAFVVIGIPGETDEHRKESLDLLLTLGLDWVYIFIATPIAGSRLYDICKTNKYFIDDNYNNHIVTKGNIRAPGIEPKEIEQYAYYMNIMINFVENSNIKNHKYGEAETYFLNVIKSYPEQAIAHYMLFKIYKETNIDKYKDHYDKYLQYYDKYIAIYKGNRFWDLLIKNSFKKEIL